MIRTAVGFMGLLILLPALQAQNKPGTPTPAQQYQALSREYDKEQMEFRMAFANAKTREEKQKVHQEKSPHLNKFASRFLELAEKNPKDPATIDALIWIVMHTPAMKSAPQVPRGKAIHLLIRDHVQIEKMADLCQFLTAAQDEDGQHLLCVVLEKSKYRSAQGQACFALAQQAENRVQRARQFRDDPYSAERYESFMGKEAVEALVKADLAKLSKEAETLYERIVRDFADLTDARGSKLGDMAKKRLDALRHPILVGKPAPEIEGEDIDDKKFKLSDYRGKVVLLDFWGHW
jgi:hypothetical protein